MEFLLKREITEDGNRREVYHEIHPVFLLLLIPVKESYPIDIFKEFLQALVGTEKQFGEAQYTLLKRLAIKQAQSADSWVEAVLLFTVYCLDKQLGEIDFWVDGFAGISEEEKRVPLRALCNRALKLYEAWAINETAMVYPSAKPYVFYLFMEAFSRLDPLVKFIRARGNEYFKLIEYIAIINSAPEAATAAKNALTDFAKAFTKNKSILSNAKTAVASFDTIVDNIQNPVNIASILQQKSLFTLVLGRPGSGKSVIIKALFLSVNDGFMPADNPLKQLYVVSLPEGNEVDSFLTKGRPIPNTADFWELHGLMQVQEPAKTALYSLALTDTRGGMITEPRKVGPDVPLQEFDKNLSRTDHLLICLDPNTLAEPTAKLKVFNGIGSRIKDLLFKDSAHAMVSIVLTKFDEYGVVMTGPRNLINTEEKLQKLIAYQSDRLGWEEFVEALLISYDDNMPLQKTLRPLLERVRPLFDTFCLTHKHLPINFYLLNAIDANDAGTFYQTGIPAIFQDFEAYVSCLIKKFQPETPPPPPPIPPQNISVSGMPNNERPNSLQIKWDSEEGMKYYLKRRIGTEKGIWGEWETLKNAVGSSYQDYAGITAGKQYVYEVIAENSATGAKSLPSFSVVYPVYKKPFDWIPLIVLGGVILLFLALYLGISHDILSGNK